jgi:hypothetical protein
MSLAGLVEMQLSASRSVRARVDSVSDTLPGTHRRRQVRVESSVPSLKNKAEQRSLASHLYTHARAIAGSEASTIDAYALPAVLDRPVEGRRGETTPQKQTKSSRRTKSHRPNRWSRSGAGSSDDTGSDPKPHASALSPQQTGSPQSTRSTARAPNSHTHTHIAANNAAAHQGRLMAAAFGVPSGDSRRGVASPRPKGRGTGSD